MRDEGPAISRHRLAGQGIEGAGTAYWNLPAARTPSAC